jgi:hypothetical protein
MTETIDAQIELWRGHMAKRPGVTAEEIDELEDHLRGHIESLTASGLSSDEAFLVAVKRLGSQSEIAREFARDNSQRLWKQLVLDDKPASPRASADRGGWLPMLVWALIAAAIVKVPGLFGKTIESDFEFYARNVSILGLAGVVGYLLWRHQARVRYIVAVVAGLGILAVAANLYPLDEDEDALPMTALHVPIVMWLVIGLAYATYRWRRTEGRMDYVRFTGEWIIYMVLIQAASMVLLGIIAVVPMFVGLDPGPFMAEWLIPGGAAAAAVVATWLVEAKKSVIENMAPVLARIFTPLFTAAFLSLFVVVLVSGDLANLDRDLLIACDAILVVAVGLVLYNLTARGSGEKAGWFDWMQLTLVASALALDAIALTNILVRIGEGWTFNRTVVLGANLILLVNLAITAWLFVKLLRGKPAVPPALERWQTSLLPVYGLWAMVVILVLPPIFGLSGW